MAFFMFEEAQPRYMKGICLRARPDSNPDIFDAIDATGMAKDITPWPPGMPMPARPQLITIQAVDKKNNRVYLESRYQVDENPSLGHYKSLTIGFWIAMNPGWVCESDVGRGCVRAKK